MAVINSNWYNKNEFRRYPLVDGITSSEGLKLPDNLIVDCSLWVPEAAGSSVWISSALVTNNLVTITIQAVTPPSLSFTPIASISLVKPLTKYRPYQVKALYPGVAGWISFGTGTDENISMLFADNSGTEILPKKVLRYSGNYLSGVQEDGVSTVLTGLVKLKAAGDIAFRLETRDLDENGGGVSGVPTILVGLTTEGDVESTHERYLSKQMSRPENGNCEKQPILFINEVPPDCNGNINIVFPPGIVDTRHPGDNGIILDYTLGFVDVCVNNPGVIPRDEKLCNLPVTSDPVVVVIPPVPPVPPLPPDYPNGQPFNVTVCEDFYTPLNNFIGLPTAPWFNAPITINDITYGPQTKPRVWLNVTSRDATHRLIRDFTNGDHRNRLMQLEVQFGPSLNTSDPLSRGIWDNIGLIYNYQSQTSYNFVSIIWLGHNAPGVPLADDPRNAMLVLGHKSISTQWLTPYMYAAAPRGLRDGHFIDSFKFIQIDPTKPYMIQLTTVEGPSGTTTATVNLLEIDPFFTYIPFENIFNISSTINVAPTSRVGVVAVASSDVYASFLAIDPVSCDPVILQQS